MTLERLRVPPHAIYDTREVAYTHTQYMELERLGTAHTIYDTREVVDMQPQYVELEEASDTHT